jgi:DNA-binding MarR family transcriptional regulator
VIGRERALSLTWTTDFVNTFRAKRRADMAGDRIERRSARAARQSAPEAPNAPDLGVLNERLGYFVRRLQVWIFQDLIRRLARLELSPAQFSVLVVIAANRGLSQTELADTLGIERARLVRLLHRLQQRGLVRRLPSSSDGRRHALELTASGETTLARANDIAEQHETMLREKLGAKRHKMLLNALREF